MGDPVIRRMTVSLLIEPGRTPDIPIPELIIPRAARLLEPLILITRMVNHQIHQQLHSPLVTAMDQLLHVRHGSVFVCDAVIIRNIITHIHWKERSVLWSRPTCPLTLGTLVTRTQPYDVDAEFLDVVQPGNDAGDVAHAVIFGVGV